MSGASKVMYTIANAFNYIALLTGIAGIVVSSLVLCGIIPNTTEYTYSSLLTLVISASIAVFFTFVLIGMTRIAKANGSSKGWDFLFIILGIFGFNIFYVLGGIFGLVAPR